MTDDISSTLSMFQCISSRRRPLQLIVKLRQKIEDVPAEPRHLLTVHTLGYRMEV